MANYLIISFGIFALINYKYIYSFIDSKFLYTTSGSKLELETSKNKKPLKFLKYRKLEMIIFLLIFLILFFINYSISTIAFNQSPLIAFQIINLESVVNESKFVLIYHILCGSSLILLINEHMNYIKIKVLRLIKNSLQYNEELKGQKACEFLLAKDENDEAFYIPEASLYQNVLITGSIGSGKTSSAISRLTYNLIKSGKGGLILDVKGNFVNTVEKMCKNCGREENLRIISQNSQSYFNILEENIKILELANRFKQVITLLSTNNNSDSYWLDKVENVLMNMFILMKYLNKLDMLTLHKLITENSFLEQTILSIKEKVKNNIPDDQTAFELANAISFIENEYLKLDSRISGIIKSEITRLTIPLVTDYTIFNQFCMKNNKVNVEFGKNEIVVLSINIAENKLLAKIMATFIKLSYQKYILSNINSNKSNFFISDEFQEFCNSEDAHFFSLSREAKCINIISTQSYSSLKNTLKDQNATNVIIQNLVNKIWFRNDDNYTVSEIVKQLGKINVIRENKSISEASQESKKYIFKEGFRNKKSSISKSLNYVSVKENEYDENFFSRELKNFEALALTMTNNGMVAKKIIFERWKENV